MEKSQRISKLYRVGKKSTKDSIKTMLRRISVIALLGNSCSTDTSYVCSPSDTRLTLHSLLLLRYKGYSSWKMSWNLSDWPCSEIIQSWTVCDRSFSKKLCCFLGFVRLEEAQVLMLLQLLCTWAVMAHSWASVQGEEEWLCPTLLILLWFFSVFTGGDRIPLPSIA